MVLTTHNMILEIRLILENFIDSIDNITNANIVTNTVSTKSTTRVPPLSSAPLFFLFSPYLHDALTNIPADNLPVTFLLFLFRCNKNNIKRCVFCVSVTLNRNLEFRFWITRGRPPSYETRLCFPGTYLQYGVLSTQ